ncbi:DUF6514 family protein [Clostridium sp.]|uniref:DUF6514 family protein n=1 Tax=Clostridium sp. TaxID=1506 RepID=UPI0039915CCD
MMLVVENLKRNFYDENSQKEYFYRLTVKKYENKSFYGIEIERKDFEQNNLINIERENMDYIETNKTKALELLKMLWENQVSPIHLIDILGTYADNTIERYSLSEKFCV